MREMSHLNASDGDRRTTLQRPPTRHAVPLPQVRLLPCQLLQLLWPLWLLRLLLRELRKGAALAPGHAMGCCRCSHDILGSSVQH